MTTTERELPADDTGHPARAGYPEGRLLALRCLGIPQVATRAGVSRRRALTHRLAAYCSRIRPRNTAELASLVLRMGEEIDTRERMLDAALRPTGDYGAAVTDLRPASDETGQFQSSPTRATDARPAVTS